MRLKTKALFEFGDPSQNGNIHMGGVSVGPFDGPRTCEIMALVHVPVPAQRVPLRDPGHALKLPDWTGQSPIPANNRQG
jgi:hypothetical protein